VKTAVDGKVALVNSAAEELLGYERNEMIGKTITDLFPEQDAKIMLLHDPQAGGSSFTNEEISSSRRARKHSIHCGICRGCHGSTSNRRSALSSSKNG